MVLHHSTRVLLTLGFAWLVSYVLFSALEQLTQKETMALLVPEQKNLLLDFVHLRQEEELSYKRRLPQKPKQRQRPQVEKPQYQMPLSTNRPHLKVSLPRHTNLQSGLSIGALGAPRLVPQVKVQPLYPLRAQARGIEGWVEVAFSIDETGQVVNPRIVGAEPPGVFERATLKAVRRWRYQPLLVDGKAVAQDEVRAVIDFVLE